MTYMQRFGVYLQLRETVTITAQQPILRQPLETLNAIQVSFMDKQFDCRFRILNSVEFSQLTQIIDSIQASLPFKQGNNLGRLTKIVVVLNTINQSATKLHQQGKNRLGQETLRSFFNLESSVARAYCELSIHFTSNNTGAMQRLDRDFLRHFREPISFISGWLNLLFDWSKRQHHIPNMDAKLLSNADLSLLANFRQYDLILRHELAMLLEAMPHFNSEIDLY